MATPTIGIGSRVRVSPQAPQHAGRTGVALEPASEGDSSRWVIRFDWPLGGFSAFAVLAENELEPLDNLPRLPG